MTALPALVRSPRRLGWLPAALASARARSAYRAQTTRVMCQLDGAGRITVDGHVPADLDAMEVGTIRAHLADSRR